MCRRWGREVDAANLICRIKKGEELKFDISELTFEMVALTILISCDRFQGSHFVYQIIPSVTVIYDSSDSRITYATIIIMVTRV